MSVNKVLPPPVSDARPPKPVSKRRPPAGAARRAPIQPNSASRQAVRSGSSAMVRPQAAKPAPLDDGRCLRG